MIVVHRERRQRLWSRRNRLLDHGRMRPCHGRDPGSIPGNRKVVNSSMLSFFSFYENIGVFS